MIGIVKKLRVFMLYDWRTKLLFMEALFLLGWARVLKSTPFPKVAPSLGRPTAETSFSIDESDKKIVGHVSRAINIVSRYTFWESKCLVKAIAAMKMLERRNIESTIYFGTAKDKTGKMLAHAWLRSGPFYLTGFEEMDKFIVVNKFAKEIRKSSPEEAS